MPELPSPERAFEFENGFYQTCDPLRLAVAMAQYDLYKLTLDVPGALVECGVFKGTSLVRWAMFREFFGAAAARRIVAFDTFGKFPAASHEADRRLLAGYLGAAGDESLTREQTLEMLRRRQLDRNLELIEGDICHTVPSYVAAHPELRISLLHLDTDLYEPAVAILEQLWPRVERGGLMILDDYAAYPGETRAVEEYFRGQNVRIRKLPFVHRVCYLVKD